MAPPGNPSRMRLALLPAFVARAVAMTPAFLALHAVPPDFDFTLHATRHEWMASHDVAFAPVTTNGLGVVIRGPDPFFTSPPLHVPPHVNLMVELRLRSQTGGWAQLFWFEGAASEADSVHFHCPRDQWTDVCLSLPPSAVPMRLRIDPPGTEGRAQLAWLRVSPAGGRGVHDAKVVADSLRLAVGNVRAPFQVMEVLPHQQLSDVSRGSLGAVGSPAGASGWIVPRMAPAAEGQRDRVLSGFVAIEAHPVHGWRPAGPVHHAGQLEAIAPPAAPPPRPSSKKGLQVQMTEDAVALGVRHAALNVNLTSLMDPEGRPDSYEWIVAGRRHGFDRAAIDALPVKPLSDSGAAVTLILLAYASGDPARDAIWLHPRYDSRAPNRLGAFNPVTEDGARWLQAAVEFLCHRFSRPGSPHGQVAHLIVGNEVTAHWHWANMGEVPASIFIKDYLRSVRLIHAAAARVTSSIRVHLSLDHHWNLTYGNAPLRAIPGRRLIDDFARTARLEGDFPWHVAYHPYPEDLFKAATWKDTSAFPAPTSPRITFKNLEVLTTYLARPELTWNRQPRRILLSEQGFHSDGTPRGDQLQAAAYAYAWHKVDSLPGIDAFILHRHVDHRDEGGLNLGLWRRRPGSIADPESPKPIHEVFRMADTPGRDEAFAFALPIIGVPDWSHVRVPANSGPDSKPGGKPMP